ncbi:MAG TPA: serine hydrolase [Chitinophagaceae bacterium]|nr:serine hydrolase [Chitinophagaceae bacterium]
MKKILLLVFIPFTICAQRNTAQLLDEFITGQSKYFQFNGNVLVAVNGKPILQKAYGYADYDTKRMLDNNSAFELASVSKQFTAMGILLLKERKQLRLDDTLRKFFPQLPYENITIRQLLTHTSGLPDYMDAMAKKWDHKKIAFNNDMISFLATEKPAIHFKPGEKWEYSNTGYALLSSIIEKVSGMSYHDFLARNIFKPLGMSHTFVYNTRRSSNKIPEDYALGFVHSDSLNAYVLPDKVPSLDMVYWLDGITGDGTVNSTTGDLLVWENALMAGKLIGDNAVKEMLSPLVPTSPHNTRFYYGFGVEVQPQSGYGKIISHDGGWPGYSTLLKQFVDSNKTVIMLCNNEINPGFVEAGIESLLFGDTLVMPYEHKEIAIDTALVRKYAGKYNAFITMEFIDKEGKLYRHRNGTPDIELKPESATKFFYSDGTDRQIEFETDKNGNVIKAWFLNTGQKGELKKIE